MTLGRLVQISYYVLIKGCSTAYTEYPIFTSSEELLVYSYHAAIDQYTGNTYPVVASDRTKQIKLAVKDVAPSDETWIWGSIICFKK